MVLFIHITVALASLVAAGAVYLRPSHALLRATYALTAGMLGSGTLLVIQNSAHLVRTCIEGLVLLGVILYQVAAARNKLSESKEKIRG